MKTAHILGLNARSQHFTFAVNTRKGKLIAKSKILTSRHLRALGIPTPKIYKKFFTPEDIFNFDWNTLPGSFALKPSKGLGGGGIIVIKRRSKDGTYWTTTSKDKVTEADLKLHVLDILEGAYSTGSVPDSAFIQEYVGRHNAFTRYAYRGTPDIRVIVYNKVPVMSMLRLPTKESGGRANVHQGAIAVGIDLASGITTKAVWHGNIIKFKPETNRRLSGIKIPYWNQILEIAAKCTAIPGLGYMGVDIVLHPDRGPMVLEINSQPGLQIQLANGSGLKKRLERVEDLDVVDYEEGVKIAKAIFSERFSDQRKPQEMIKAVEEIYIKNKLGKKQKVLAKIDTGAWSSALDIKLARKMGIYSKSRKNVTRRKLSALGEEQRPVIDVVMWIAGKRIKTLMTVADRSKLRYPVIIGRVDLDGFIINPIISKQQRVKAKKW